MKWKTLPFGLRLSERDIEFLQDLLAGNAREREALLFLLADRGSMIQLLDTPEVYDALLNQPGSVDISSEFYFYVLIRRALTEAGLGDAALAEYLAATLGTYAKSNPLRRPREGGGPNFLYVHEILMEIHRLDSAYQRFNMYVFAGNQILILTGLFPEYIRHREQRRGAPGLAYYEEFGRASFRIAGNHPLAEEFDLRNVCCDLAENFSLARKSLNSVTDRMIFLD